MNCHCTTKLSFRYTRRRCVLQQTADLDTRKGRDFRSADSVPALGYVFTPPFLWLWPHFQPDDLNKNDMMILYAFRRSTAMIPDTTFAIALSEWLDQEKYQFALVLCQ